MTNRTPPTISTTSPSSPHSSPSSRPTSPTRNLRRPASHGRLAQLMLPGRSRSSSSASASNQVAYADEASPASSGRTTPEQRRRTGKAAATSLLASDAKYKKFASMIDKSLASFESVNEWADFISFLSRLLKTLQTPSPPYTEIPRKLIISKRLAQCLNPALPSGVHQRALDVYSYVFTTIGVEGLRRDLLIWSSGLFPFFQYAATSVRPILIDLYERYYLPLGEDLRPATKALILALLPAMEEETGDFFDRVYTLFGKLSAAISPAFFLQNIFLTLISNPTSRLAALNYLAKSFVKPPDTVEDKSDIGLIVRGVAAALQDDNMLVRRHGLDILLRILPLDGTILSECEVKDKELLVRSASAVVLQRELSLSRRVYTWLLGKEESPEKQVAFFRTYGLDLLAGILQADMDTLGAETQSYDAQKPFKIFLSLLDRWEIGGALSDKLVMHALEAIRVGLPRVSPDMREEMLDTATAVYEAVEPIIIWRALFASLQTQETGPATPPELISWVVGSLRQSDEEVLKLHVPLVLDHILKCQLSRDSPSADRGAIALAARLLALVPASLFERTGDDSAVSNVDTGDVAWTDRVYGTTMPDVNAAIAATQDALPASIVSNAFRLHSSMMSASSIDEEGFLTMTGIVGALIDTEAATLRKIQDRAWLGHISKRLPTLSSFTTVDSIVSVVLQASRSTVFASRLQLSESGMISTMLSALLHFLRPSHGSYHARVVELVWECNQIAEPHALENEVTKQLADPIGHPQAEAAFGVLWRLTDDAMQPGELFFTPVISLVDNLKSPDSLVRQRSGLWIRQNLGSYLRVLDPLLSRLNSAHQDLDTATYLCETVTALIRCGSDEMRHICRATLLKQSSHSAIAKLAETNERLTYLDLIVDTAITLLRLEIPINTKRSSTVTQSKVVVRIHSAALDLLHLLLESGDLPESTIAAVRECVIGEIRRAIRQHRLLLQPQMLSVLKFCLEPKAQHRPGHGRKRSHMLEKTATAPESESDLAIMQVIVEGVSSPQNRTMLQPWIEFILAISTTVATRHSMILILCECLSDQIRRSLLQLRTMYQVADAAAVADSEPVLLLHGLETLLSLVFAARKDTRMSEEGQRSQAEGGGGTGIMGLMSGVFTVEAPSNDKISDSIQYLDDAINALLLTWSVTSKPYSSGSSSTSESSVMARAKAKARLVLDQLFKAVPAAMIGSCVQVWAAHSADIDDEAIFDCIDSLAPSAQKVVEIIAEAVTGRQGKDKNGEISSDPSLLGFLEVYVGRLEAPIAVQIWSTLFAFARDILASSSPSSKAQLYPVLRCVTIVCKTVSTTSALEDRRLRRDLQDVYLKLLDGVVTNIIKSAESALWDRDVTAGDLSAIEEKSNDARQEEGLRAVHEYVARTVVPSLRSFLADNDKVAAAASTISAGLLQPAFRRQRVDTAVLHILLELAKLPSATKAWRLQVGEAFNDQRFFKIKPDDSVEWKPLINSLMDSDRERFGELLGRITAAPSSNIFTNREQEMISRSLNLRRLSFVLLAAERNHYLAQLPSIQEKLVDILRTDIVSPRVHSEVYLCLRVLMCRISPQHLTNFWPVILTELLKVFESTMDDPPADGSEDLALILAACKFLDLLLIIQSEDFQVHQWMFVTDTTDAAFPPEDFLPEAIMDRLSEILSEHSHVRQNHGPVVLDGYDEDQQSLRRPRLTALRHLSSLTQLQPFFARASIDTFEGVYSDQGTDWEAVEAGLDHEIFETR